MHISIKMVYTTKKKVGNNNFIKIKSIINNDESTGVPLGIAFFYKTMFSTSPTYISDEYQITGGGKSP